MKSPVQLIKYVRKIFPRKINLRILKRLLQSQFSQNELRINNY